MNDAFQDGPSLADFLPDTSQGYKAVAGSVNPSMAGKKAYKDAIIKKLETIQDPEIRVNIYELGLIYDIITHEGGDVDITMSLTAPGCPVAGEMPQQVANAVASLAEDGEGQIGAVSVTLVWDPAWTTDRMSEDAKMALDFMAD